MATNVNLPKNETVETFHLLCLDDLNENADQRSTRTDLRRSINRLKIFTNVNRFEKYIKKMFKQDRAILVLGIEQGQEILSRIHQFEQVLSIYIYGIGETEGEQWMKLFPKVEYHYDSFTH